MSSPPAIEALARWVHLKKYRIEVTYGVYVFTPVEKAAFWTLFCSLFTVISFAAAIFAQRNVLPLIRFASEYVGGDGSSAGAVPDLFPKGDVALSIAGAGITSLAETIGSAANSQVP
ncbi:hypothetical protein GGR54DRAFT_642763 [Hypoxylon sp. NC1633]|nr:hypothetical protein GGR54DRAFT_642763 [Hypoxylon sp. NC1633]